MISNTSLQGKLVWEQKVVGGKVTREGKVRKGLPFLGCSGKKEVAGQEKKKKIDGAIFKPPICEKIQCKAL